MEPSSFWQSANKEAGEDCCAGQGVCISRWKEGGFGPRQAQFKEDKTWVTENHPSGWEEWLAETNIYRATAASLAFGWRNQWSGRSQVCKGEKKDKHRMSVNCSKGHYRVNIKVTTDLLSKLGPFWEWKGHAIIIKGNWHKYYPS